MRLEILDHISDPGMPRKPNEDALCKGLGEGTRLEGALAAVFDGATGLGDSLIFPDTGSDAAWLAQLAAGLFPLHDVSTSVAEIVRQVAREARDAVAAACDLDALPRHAWPTASFEMARLRNDVLELSGLGDCCAYVLEPDDVIVTHTAMPSSREIEMASARHMLDATGGFGPGGDIVREGATLDAMRRGRARHNTPGGHVWTLGLAPETAEHVAVLELAARPGTRILLMSDGFAALCEAYQLYDEPGLVKAAATLGLQALLAQLRHVERVDDPDARRFARFKRCDDASAILLEIRK
jgi:serine/threonine protein phosphatase PrpC